MGGENHETPDDNMSQFERTIIQLTGPNLNPVEKRRLETNRDKTIETAFRSGYLDHALRTMPGIIKRTNWDNLFEDLTQQAENLESASQGRHFPNDLKANMKGVVKVLVQGSADHLAILGIEKKRQEVGRDVDRNWQRRHGYTFDSISRLEENAAIKRGDILLPDGAELLVGADERKRRELLQPFQPDTPTMDNTRPVVPGYTDEDLIYTPSDLDDDRNLVFTPEPVPDWNFGTNIDETERRVFGEGLAFSLRWTRSHGIHDLVRPSIQAGTTRPFSPAEILSEVLETGLTQQHQWYQISAAINDSPEQNFRIAALNGLVGLINVNHQMKTGRIEYVAEALKAVPPQAMAEWLVVDRETRQSLEALFQLAGYKVKDGVRIDTSGKPPFSDFLNLSHEQIEAYLKRVQDTVHTDRGIVIIAYTIFRSLGFPHENAKFANDLVGKYRYDPKTKKGDIDAEDIAPFIDRFKNPKNKKQTLKMVLEQNGMDAFIVSLNSLQAQQIAREWEDMKLILDAMDKISDIRNGVGGAANLPREKRYEAIRTTQEFAVALAKRKFSDATASRILDHKKVSQAPGAGELTQREKESQALRDLFGFIPRRKPKSIK